MLHCTDLGSGRGRYAASTVRCVACDLHRMGWGSRVEAQQGWIIAVIAPRYNQLGWLCFLFRAATNRLQPRHSVSISIPHPAPALHLRTVKILDALRHLAFYIQYTGVHLRPPLPNPSMIFITATRPPPETPCICVVQILDALRHLPFCIQYMQQLSHPMVFRFCAIPQIMAIGTLAICYNNGKVFEGALSGWGRGARCGSHRYDGGWRRQWRSVQVWFEGAVRVAAAFKQPLYHSSPDTETLPPVCEQTFSPRTPCSHFAVRRCGRAAVSFQPCSTQAPILKPAHSCKQALPPNTHRSHFPPCSLSISQVL